MGQTESKRTDNLSEQEVVNDINILRRLAENGGPVAVSVYIDNNLNRWKTEKVNFGVTGRFSTGKSTFINTVRNVKKGDEGYAKIGSTPTTETPMLYMHPQNKQIAFYDLPGHSSDFCPREDYISKVNMSDYDFVFIFFEKDYSEDELWLCRQLRKLDKPFSLVHSKIDIDIADEVRNEEDPKAMIEKLREKHERKLNSNPELKGIKRIFLISSRYPDLEDWSDLLAYVQDNIDGFKAQALIFSLDSFSKEILGKKYQMLKKRIIAASALAATVAATPIPVLDVAINIAILVHEVRHYLTVFGIEEKRVNDLKDFDHSLLKCRSLLRLNMDMVSFVGGKITSYMTLLLSQSVLDLILPLVGSVISSTIAARITYTFLNDMLQDVKHDAVLIYDHIMKTNTDHRM